MRIGRQNTVEKNRIHRDKHTLHHPLHSRYCCSTSAMRVFMDKNYEDKKELQHEITATCISSTNFLAPLRDPQGRVKNLGTSFEEFVRTIVL